MVAIFAGVRGFLDALAIGDIGRFETSLLEHVRADHADLLAAIRDTGEISDDTEKKLLELTEAFSKGFV